MDRRTARPSQRQAHGVTAWMGARDATIARNVTITDPQNMSELADGFTFDRDRGVYVSSSKTALARWITTSRAARRRTPARS